MQLLAADDVSNEAASSQPEVLSAQQEGAGRSEARIGQALQRRPRHVVAQRSCNATSTLEIERTGPSRLHKTARPCTCARSVSNFPDY